MKLGRRQQAVMDALREHGPMTTAEIQRALGLSCSKTLEVIYTLQFRRLVDRRFKDARWFRT